MYFDSLDYFMHYNLCNISVVAESAYYIYILARNLSKYVTLTFFDVLSSYLKDV